MLLSTAAPVLLLAQLPREGGYYFLNAPAVLPAHRSAVHSLICSMPPGSGATNTIPGGHGIYYPADNLRSISSRNIRFTPGLQQSSCSIFLNSSTVFGSISNTISSSHLLIALYPPDALFSVCPLHPFHASDILKHEAVLICGCFQYHQP